MDRAFRQFLGRSAELVVMAELTFRGYNVANPEVALGEDLFVDGPNRAMEYRVQVKGASLRKRRRSSVCAAFNIQTRELLRDESPELIYVFLTRTERLWETIIISRKELLSR